MGLVEQVLIHDAQVHQGDGQPGAGAQLQLPGRVAGEGRLDLGEGEDGAGFRHAVAGEQVDAVVQGGLGEPLGQG